MFELSTEATAKIKHILNERDQHGPIRLMPVSAGCAGTSLDLFFDEPTANDLRLEENGLAFIIDKTVYEQAKPISIDYSENPVTPGFLVSSALDSGAACGDCACC